MLEKERAENVEGDEQDNHIPEFLLKELSSAIDSLKRGKSTDSTGIRVEDLKAAHEEATKMIHEVFNLIVKQNSMTNPMTPSSWKNSYVTVIYKIGDPTKPENYRPICSVPMLHKLFSIDQTHTLKVVAGQVLQSTEYLGQKDRNQAVLIQLTSSCQEEQLAADVQ